MTSTRITRYTKAPRASIYAALIDASAIAKWRVPAGMTSLVHEFEGREGGRFRVSLTYSAPGQLGKTNAHTDTYHGYFKTLVPNERVVEVIEFETSDSSLRGEMTITVELSDAVGGTELIARHENLPPGVSPVDNEIGWRMSLAKLANLVEGTNV